MDDGYHFYRKDENSEVWWVANTGKFGMHLFTFDKEKLYNLFQDYPYKLSDEELEIFDKYEPFWADFFRGRRKESQG